MKRIKWQMQSLMALGIMLMTCAGSVAQLSLSNPFVLPGDLTPAPAASKQTTPSLAKGGDGYLAVWVDSHTQLHPFASFSGPFDSPHLGSMMDIYAARLDANGNLIDTTPIILYQGSAIQAFPSAAWNGENWLVVWATERE